MNYTNLNESQKAQLMDVAVKFLVSTVDGYCANEADANKQEYATRLLLHLKSHVELQQQEIEQSKKLLSKSTLEIVEKYENAEPFETINDIDIVAIDKGDLEFLIGYTMASIEIERRLKEEIEQLKVVEQAYEAWKLAK